MLLRGVRVFAQYLGLVNLTKKALIDFDDEIFYETDNLLRMDNNDLIHY